MGNYVVSAMLRITQGVNYGVPLLNPYLSWRARTRKREHGVWRCLEVSGCLGVLLLGKAPVHLGHPSTVTRVLSGSLPRGSIG
ncbi:hypothetical protein HYPBUDRAFT_230276 [Hyphopichia burtonii NRRL Y-1933]|uniref:Uncharacterized protein n=1 Tax=Hyphopichia burtonii NRRL Y-1933 TaxID=984485 RepID=A0A1E4RCY6_9ASCO|nr:hypothetical protein HYPBUDRAFT_230276 [Hyphopichia burtonii NRRL Y-1933]ODV65134.1 hypothetical protein HYPBUDRAFT_230276 [Hyphopichia burtonii NRRL Y-1933]